jgi:drug/metabolite transporter (DMT)-like permease
MKIPAILSRKFLPAFWCLIAAALFGASTPIAKVLLSNVGVLSLAGLLYLGAAFAAIPYSIKGGSKKLRRRPANVRRILGAIIFGGIAGPALLLLGLKMAPAASTALWLNMEGTATAFFAVLFFREHVGYRTWVAIGLVFFASILLASPQGFSMAPAAALIVLASICWGLDNNFTAVLDGYTPAQTTLAKGVFAGSFNLGLGWLIGESLPLTGVVVLALVVGAFCYGASMLLYVMGAQALGATRSQMFFSSAPFFGVLIAWSALGEQILGVQLAAGAIMIGGLIFMLTDHHEHAHAHKARDHTHNHCHDDDHHNHEHSDLPLTTRHCHPHPHEEQEHHHSHEPDLHHRHEHEDE